MKKFSLSKTKLTVAAVSILLIAATGIGASDAAVVDLNLVSYCINHSRIYHLIFILKD